MITWEIELTSGNELHIYWERILLFTLPADYITEKNVHQMSERERLEWTYYEWKDDILERAEELEAE